MRTEARGTILLLLFLLLLGKGAAGQTSEWWVDLVGWDGVSPYQNYLRLAPAYMGPNALPVPALHGDHNDSTSLLSGGATCFRADGENTVSGIMALRWRASSWFRLGVHVVPLEYYRTSHELKALRRVHYLSYDESLAGGDFYVESLITLPRKWLGRLDPELRLGIKTASGTNLGAARFTDTPGYYFDVSTHWASSPGHRWEVMTGFLVYQTYLPGRAQNDCFLWGLGYAWSHAPWAASASIRGFQGYFFEGDGPIVSEVEGSWRTRGRWEFYVRAGMGIRDYPFRYLGLGTRCHLKLGMEKMEGITE